MSTFRYQIIGADIGSALYLGHLFVAHGFNYDWEYQAVDRGSTGTLEVRIVRGNNGTSMSNIAKFTFTTEISALRYFGLLHPDSLQDKRESGWGYMVRNAHFAKDIPALPIRLEYVQPISSDGTEWQGVDYLLRDKSVECVSAVRSGMQESEFVFAIDLLEWIKWGMFRESNLSTPSLESWADVYGIGLTQSLASECFLEEIIQRILQMMVDACPHAFPVWIDRYPPGKTAPLLITGDSDSASPEQLALYLSRIEQAGARSTVLVKDFSRYPDSLLQDAVKKGHCLGLHPYSSSHSVEDFQLNMQKLLAEYQAIIASPLYGVRNHYFQHLGKDQMLRLERTIPVTFDLNCVAASGSTWIGSGSGIGFPIAFPPEPNASRFDLTPMQLPTIIEDDVFIFDYDYCYKPFHNGNTLPIDLCVTYLNDWILSRRLPVTVNLHPEHVTRNTRFLFDAILNWRALHAVWAPTLEEFAIWVDLRGRVKLSVEEDATQYGVRVKVWGEQALSVQLNRTKSAIEQNLVITTEPGNDVVTWSFLESEDD